MHYKNRDMNTQETGNIPFTHIEEANLIHQHETSVRFGDGHLESCFGQQVESWIKKRMDM